jgi:hypothetical protein
MRVHVLENKKLYQNMFTFMCVIGFALNFQQVIYSVECYVLQLKKYCIQAASLACRLTENRVIKSVTDWHYTDGSYARGITHQSIQSFPCCDITPLERWLMVGNNATAHHLQCNYCEINNH